MIVAMGLQPVIVKISMSYEFIINEPERRAKVTDSHICIDNVFDDTEMEKIIHFCEGKGLFEARIFKVSDPETVRKKRVTMIQNIQFDSDSAWIFERINGVMLNTNAQYWGFDLNGYEHFQYSLYDSENRSRYDWHTDLILNQDMYTSCQVRKLSIILLLNDGFEGGEFQINRGDPEQPVVPRVKKGTAVIFPSFLIHRVTPVTKGSRKSIAAFCLGPKFR